MSRKSTHLASSPSRLAAAVLAATLGIIITFSSCDKPSPAPPTQAADKVSLRLAWLPNVEFAGILLAAEKGYYKEADIDLTINPGGIGLDSVHLVAGGSDEIGVAEGSQLIIAKSKGIPVRAVTAQFQQSPMAYITLADSGITSVQQFRGKRIGTQPSFVFVLETMLAHNGMTLKDVKMTPVGFDVRPLTEKQVDAFLSFETNEPILLDQRGVKTNVITARDNGYVFYTDVIFTTDKFAREKPEVLRRFLQATARGWRDALANPDEAARVVVAKYGKDLNLEHQQRALKLISGLVTAGVGTDGVGMMRQESWAQGVENLLRYKQIEQMVDAGQIFTNEYLQQGR